MASKINIEKAPIDFVYCFVSDDRLKQVKKYFGTKAYKSVSERRARQLKLLKTYSVDNGMSLQQGLNELSNLIVAQYDYTPTQIITKWMAGETVAGKNWRKGIYGVGATVTYSSIFHTGASSGDVIHVDKSTGALYKGTGTTISAEGTPIIKNVNGKSEVVGYSYTIGGNTYTTQKVDGVWFANTFGTSAGSFNADGTVYTADKAADVWTTIETCMPLFQKIIDWILSLFGSKDKTVLTAKQTVPQQSDFCPDKSSSTSLSSMGIVGAALIGGVLLFGLPKTKKK